MRPTWAWASVRAWARTSSCSLLCQKRSESESASRSNNLKRLFRSVLLSILNATDITATVVAAEAREGWDRAAESRPRSSRPRSQEGAGGSIRSTDCKAVSMYHRRRSAWRLLLQEDVLKLEQQLMPYDDELPTNDVSWTSAGWSNKSKTINKTSSPANKNYREPNRVWC